VAGIRDGARQSRRCSPRYDLKGISITTTADASFFVRSSNGLPTSRLEGSIGFPSGCSTLFACRQARLLFDYVSQASFKNPNPLGRTSLLFGPYLDLMPQTGEGRKGTVPRG
jgi:hypothetical protein